MGMGRPMVLALSAALAWPAMAGAQNGWDRLAAQLGAALPAGEPQADAILRALAVGGVQTAIDMLAKSILASRQQALHEGTAPIPAAIRQRLAGYVPAVDLDAVRWRVGGGDEMSLQRNAILNGPATAITLLDVVVFEDEGDALANAELWAHELHHVGQYRLWGLQEFSRRYVTDHRTVEAEALAFAAGWRAARGRR